MINFIQQSLFLKPIQLQIIDFIQIRTSNEHENIAP